MNTGKWMTENKIDKWLLEHSPKSIELPKYYIPTREEVESLKIGDLAPDCFGNMSEVVDIFGRGDDINGDAYVCYYVKFGSSGSMSNSLKEGELLRTVAICNEHNSWELDKIEKELNNARRK